MVNTRAILVAVAPLLFACAKAGPAPVRDGAVSDASSLDASGLADGSAGDADVLDDAALDGALPDADLPAAGDAPLSPAPLPAAGKGVPPVPPSPAGVASRCAFRAATFSRIASRSARAPRHTSAYAQTRFERSLPRCCFHAQRLRPATRGGGGVGCGPTRPSTAAGARPLLR